MYDKENVEDYWLLLELLTIFDCSTSIKSWWSSKRKIWWVESGNPKRNKSWLVNAGWRVDFAHYQMIFSQLMRYLFSRLKWFSTNKMRLPNSSLCFYARLLCVLYINDFDCANKWKHLGYLESVLNEFMFWPSPFGMMGSGRLINCFEFDQRWFGQKLLNDFH